MKKAQDLRCIYIPKIISDNFKQAVKEMQEKYKNNKKDKFIKKINL